jgi:hypothetical protein
MQHVDPSTNRRHIDHPISFLVIGDSNLLHTAAYLRQTLSMLRIVAQLHPRKFLAQLEACASWEASDNGTGIAQPANLFHSSTIVLLLYL